jgi:hypothetical protein
MALIAVELLVGLVDRRARKSVHLAFVWLLAALVLMPFLKKAVASDVVLVAGAALLAAGATVAYARAEAARSFMSVLTPAPVLFLVLFLFVSPVSELIGSSDATATSNGGVKKVPVVMVVFDELPTTSLLDAGGGVDPERYPAFAELAGDGTWFRRAHSIHDSTDKAVPAIMDGNYPRKGRLPTSAGHPNSIFALLGKSHVLNVSEEATTVCPRDLCKDARLDESFFGRLRNMADDLALVYAHVVAPPGMEKNLQSVSETWGDFGGTAPREDAASNDGSAGDHAKILEKLQSGERPRRFDSWIASIRSTKDRPSLNFKHAMLPHVPWEYLPDGRQYRRVATEPIPGINRQTYRDQGQIDQLRLRHLLQVGFADHQLGKLIAHLKKIGIYDEALVVVTADHGVAFRLNAFDRRLVNEQNIEELAPVPLFIKEPGQAAGKVDDSIVETTDILPTIAQMLDLELPAETDGEPALSPAVRKRTEVKMLARDLSGWLRLSGDELNARVQKQLDHKIALYGEGADGPDRIFRIGVNAHLVGQEAHPLEGDQSEAAVSLVDAGEYDEVDLRSPTIPIWITGRVSGGGGPREVAVAVNGVIRASARTFRLATGGGELVAALVPPSSFAQGKNSVTVYEVDGGRLRAMKQTAP